MTETNAGHLKILFEVEGDGGNVDVEGLWAVPLLNGYRIDNIPFYVREIAVNDIVSATADRDGLLRFTGLVQASGHSTVRLWFAEASNVARVRSALKDMGCSSEMDLDRLVAVDIPPTVPYVGVLPYLERQEAAAVFEYEEACVGQG